MTATATPPISPTPNRRLSGRSPPARCSVKPTQPSNTHSPATRNALSDHSQHLSPNSQPHITKIFPCKLPLSTNFCRFPPFLAIVPGPVHRSSYLCYLFTGPSFSPGHLYRVGSVPAHYQSTLLKVLHQPLQVGCVSCLTIPILLERRSSSLTPVGSQLASEVKGLIPTTSPTSRRLQQLATRFLLPEAPRNTIPCVPTPTSNINQSSVTLPTLRIFQSVSASRLQLWPAAIGSISREFLFASDPVSVPVPNCHLFPLSKAATYIPSPRVGSITVAAEYPSYTSGGSYVSPPSHPYTPSSGVYTAVLANLSPSELSLDSMQSGRRGRGTVRSPFPPVSRNVRYNAITQPPSRVTSDLT